MHPTPAPSAAPRVRIAFHALIAALPFADFLQTGVVAFSAAPVMGDLSATPEDYSGVATLYAVVAIAVIAAHRLLLERFGWRRLLQGASALFATGAVVCALSHSLAAFALGRVVMALGCASFLTAGRVLVNHIPASPRRFTGIKCFAAGLAWGGVAGPWLASAAFASQGWRLAFLALVAPALVLFVLADRTLRLAPAVPAALAGEGTPAWPTSLLCLIGGSFLLLHGLQRANQDFFDDARLLWGGAALGVAVLAAVVWTGRHAAASPIRFGPLAQRRYLLGLGVFGVCYLLLGANNTMLPVLLQRGLGLPLDTAGRFMALGSLAGVASWILVSRLLPRSPGPTRYYLAAFAALLACGAQLASLTDAVDPWRSVMPALLCHGAFVIVALSTTAMQTFKTLQHDEAAFSHANQVKNILAQFGVAAGTALATLCLQWRGNLHHARLVESLSPANPALQPALAAWTRWFASTEGEAAAPAMALAQLGRWVDQQALLMGMLDYFQAVALLAGVALAAVVGVAWCAPSGFRANGAGEVRQINHFFGRVPDWCKVHAKVRR